MKKIILLLFAVMFSTVFCSADEKRNSYYITNQKPLVVQPYTALPLGTIKPQGMLLKMLELQRDGLTGHLDSIYSVVCGDNNGWLGGNGDGWERGPYWIDGLLPLAYILDDERLKAKAQPWIEWSIENQREDGYFGPRELAPGYHYIPGTQQNNREDWWPKMVMLKVLQQYYTATGDKRVIDLMTRYFKYQLQTLPKFPLNHWTFWAEQRGADNLAIVYWLYNITKDKFLLELGEIIHKQTYDWTSVFSGNVIRTLNPMPDLHCVNVAEGIKAPIIYYQQHPQQKYLDAVKLGLSALEDCHGFVNGMFGGDEQLHGNDPTQGSELCTAVEMMYSFESILPINGDVYYADYLEKIAYNVLPAQITDDFKARQYFQQANQVLVTLEDRNFMNQRKTGVLFGTTIGYPCCTANMHQGWPKFVQNLWYATADDGIAALVYGSSEVTATVSGRCQVRITEQTDYPFKDKIYFSFQLEKKAKFPFHLRIPLWCKNATITINKKTISSKTENNVAIINREWNDGDVVELHLPMEIRYSHWSHNSLGIEYGPLVFALKIEEEWRKITQKDYDDTCWEVYPKSNWNFCLINHERDDNNYQIFVKDKADKYNFEIHIKDEINDNPWNLKNAPIQMLTQATRIPSWKLTNGSVGSIPNTAFAIDLPTDGIIQNVTLIPYGCTTLRISQFPVR